jgi:hypothetical protein
LVWIDWLGGGLGLTEGNEDPTKAGLFLYRDLVGFGGIACNRGARNAEQGIPISPGASRGSGGELRLGERVFIFLPEFSPNWSKLVEEMLSP